MRRASALLKSFVFLLIAPGIVAGLVPWWITHWQFERPFLATNVLRFFGALLIIAGTPAVIDSFARFAWQGLGTPAPILPTRHLVVSGLYRYVRNPMYVGVAAVVFGQALLFGNVRLVEYGVLIVGAFHLFVAFYEEPKLAKIFGDEYREFRDNVPRWIPRLRPWKGN
jgi:protein-S-isoprenylcysteine O-methyltransferase Ste14